MDGAITKSFLNDGDAFLLGELGSAAAQHVKRTVGITLGTGIGLAFAIDGKITADSFGVPLDGEIYGIFPMRTAMSKTCLHPGTPESLSHKLGQQCEVIDIAVAAAHHGLACQIFEEFGTRLGKILTSVLAYFLPDVMVLGGGIARASHVFLSATAKALGSLQCELRVSSLLDQAIVVGAAAYAFEQGLSSVS